MKESLAEKINLSAREKVAFALVLVLLLLSLFPRLPLGTNKDYPSLWGYKPIILRSSCLEPTYPQGTLLLTKRLKPLEVSPGMDVIYLQDGAYFVGSIKSITGEALTVTAANEPAEREPVELYQVKARVVAGFSLFAPLFIYLKPEAIWFITVMLPLIFALIIFAAKAFWHKRQEELYEYVEIDAEDDEEEDLEADEDDEPLGIKDRLKSRILKRS